MADDEIVTRYSDLAVAELRAGETVLDLGSGGGLDVLLSARRVGPHGRAYGLDAAAETVELARREASEAGVGNVDFLQGSIENIPLPGLWVDVVISNRVITLSDDRAAAFAEAFRVLRTGGRLGISDIVSADDTDPVRRAEAERRVGCPAGAPSVGEYRRLLQQAGFVGLSIELTADHGGGVHSALVRASKPKAPPGMVIRPMRDEDAEQVLAIYQAGLDTGNASFETTAPDWATFSEGKVLRYVAEDTATGEVLAWVAASPVSSRCVYAGVVEHSVYVHPGCQAHGIGRALMTAFIAASEDAGVWTIQSAIFPENAASLTLHQALGFRMLGIRERIGRHHGVWRDVVFLERRSPAID
ncbi:GNAT family N-acetyltransferase [Nonomuraea sp. NPDC050328]|uniref:GNAT family N-acetyltransferase n=1 Tax=Nonomuraea sp. NPDC050328 TaxID=3364361 RepID=UPI003799333E